MNEEVGVKKRSRIGGIKACFTGLTLRCAADVRSGVCTADSRGGRAIRGRSLAGGDGSAFPLDSVRADLADHTRDSAEPDGAQRIAALAAERERRQPSRASRSGIPPLPTAVSPVSVRRVTISFARARRRRFPDIKPLQGRASKNRPPRRDSTSASRVSAFVLAAGGTVYGLIRTPWISSTNVSYDKTSLRRPIPGCATWSKARSIYLVSITSCLLNGHGLRTYRLALAADGPST